MNVNTITDIFFKSGGFYIIRAYLDKSFRNLMKMKMKKHAIGYRIVLFQDSGLLGIERRFPLDFFSLFSRKTDNLLCEGMQTVSHKLF